MEYGVIEEANVPVEITELKDTESTEKFQKFIHELFQKNGILNDLRAYLRGHIVDVLKSAETGDPTSCQKNFTQRLELTYQAMNILIAEYLLRLEFNYSLSIFTSEIPLSNMVFKFAKALLKTTDSAIPKLRFSESDIWSILNYLGVKCDSEHASKIVEIYKSHTESSLLWCILKCIPMYHKPTFLEQVHTSEESLSCAKSEDSLQDKDTSEHKDKTRKCKHYAFCNACQDRVARLKEKYKRKKIKVDENPKTSEVNALNVETFMKNVGILEQSLIDEMFQQLKTVFETEVDMIREEHEKKIKRSIANHALQLQKYREELEQTFDGKQMELQESARCRQRFLCGLARRLARAQAQLTREENNLKIQIQDAEETLKKKGEEMRDQISEELNILQSHLETIKNERDDIDKQKIELENLKQLYDSNNILKEKTNKENEDLKHHYDLLKDEVIFLKKYIQTSKSAKCLVERSTMTDISDGVKSSMNNENGGSCKSEDDRLKVNQVVNDLKKRKNVNFSQTNLEDINMEINRQHSSVHDDRSEIDNITIQQLKEENERLKIFATQQSVHIDRLSIERQRLQDGIHNSRPRTAPSLLCNNNYLPRSAVNQYPDELGVQPRILFPGDAIPFIGTVRNRQIDDTRRRPLNQWRRQRNSDEPYIQPNASHITQVTDVSNNKQIEGTSPAIVSKKSSILKPVSPVNSDTREKSPTTVLRKAKQKLRSNTKKELSSTPRDKSPNAMLREAKLRLRKLEIEAEAVEKSYLEYRKRQMLKEKTENLLPADDLILKNVKNIDKKQNQSLEKLDEYYKDNDKFVYKESSETLKKDFDKYFREYQNIDNGKTHLYNVNTIIEKVKPIPESYSKFYEDDNKANNINYLETPLIEFRKLYQIGKSKITINKQNDLKSKNNNYLSTDKSYNNSTKLVKKIKSNSKIPENNEENSNINKTDLPSKNEKDISKIAEREKAENDMIKVENFEYKLNTLELNDSEHNLEDIKDTFKDNENAFSINKQKSELEIEAIEKTIELIENTEHKSNIEQANEIKTEKIKNLLMVEVENVCATTNIGVTESNQDLLVVVESCVNNKELVLSDTEYTEKVFPMQTLILSPKQISDLKDIEDKTGNIFPEITKLSENDALDDTYHSDVIKMSTSLDNKELVLSERENVNDIIPTQMTIIVSPKQDSNLKDIDDKTNNISPEITKLSEKDVLNPIYHSNTKNASSVDMALDLNKDFNSDVEKQVQEYQDDFSADVDNYNSQSDYSDNSPISIPKTSEDENFWDS